MQQMEKFLITERNADCEITDLKQLLEPMNFDFIIKTVETVAKYDETTGKFAVVALPLKIGHNLRRCATVLQARAIKSSDNETINKCKQFLKLMNSEYIIVSSQVLTSAAQNRFNKPTYLPLTDAVKKKYGICSKADTSIFIGAQNK